MEGEELHPEDAADMREPDEDGDGTVRQEISAAMVGLYKRYYGRGPTRCRTYLQPHLVLVVLGGGYSAGEQTLFEAGKWYEVRETRQVWQDSMEVRFTDVIEKLTGRKVTAFMSANRQDPDLAVEMFVLESEQAGEEPAARQAPDHVRGASDRTTDGFDESPTGREGQAVKAVEDRIAGQISAIQADYYGIGPRKAEAHYLPGKIVTVVLRETFTRAEERLIAHGSGEPLREGREQFQRLSQEQFVSVIEQETGERVETFVSTTHLDDAVAVEVFLLAGGKRTDMAAFERLQALQTAGSQDPPETSARAKGELR
jgi:uncharacterized protein YbcI